MTDGAAPGRRLPELLLGLGALALAVVVTGFVVAGAIRDVKRARDTINVTGSAREPITADLVQWSVAVAAVSPQPAVAVRQLRVRAAAVRAFLRDGGLPASAVSEPPLVTEQVLVRAPGRRRIAALRLVQRFRIASRDVPRVERIAASIGDLIAGGTPVSTSGLSYLSTDLAAARIAALKKAIADAHRRAETIVAGIGGHLGTVRSANLGVYQVVPRNSTAVSDYGINDVSSREKDVYAVVSVTFRVK